MATVQAAKRPFETKFFKNNWKTDSITFFFLIFENLIKYSSLTRGMRKNYLVAFFFRLNNNNNNNNIIYIALYTKVLKRLTMEGGTGIIKTYIT